MLNNTCKSWIESAQQDFIVIKSIITQVQNSRKRPHGQILYHCQQVVEKMLKAFLVQKGENPWGHDLNALRTSCTKFDNDFNKKRLIDHCAFLTAFNSARYPDFFAHPINAANAARGINGANRVYYFVSTKLGIDNALDV
jgi:HEPN domain-containing protein